MLPLMMMMMVRLGTTVLIQHNALLPLCVLLLKPGLPARL